MTLALIGPWAWAELGDPPPGEPPGPPTPPPPPDPPPPPLPPDPDPGGGPELEPPLDWHPFTPLISLWDVDLKVNNTTPLGENTPCRVLESSGSLDRWPYGNVYDSATEVYTHADPDDWSLNDPARTYDLMQLHNVSLFLHDANAAIPANYIENTDYRCDWISLAALNDHIEAVEGPTPETFTGIVLGWKLPGFVALPRATADDLDTTVDDLDMCFYRSWVARARAEAFVHPHHKVVLVDEMHRMLASPFAKFGGQAVPWGRPDFSVLHDLAQEDDATDPASARAYCDAVWEEPEEPFDPIGNGWHPAPSLDEAPVELWGKFNAATVPLFLVDSSILGAHYEEVSLDAPGTALLAGDRLIAEWQVVRRPVDPVKLAAVRLRYMLTPIIGSHLDDLELRAVVNGIPLPEATLRTAGPGVSGHEPHRRVVAENIYAVDVVIWEPGYTTLWPWDQGVPLPNTVDVRLVANADSPVYSTAELTATLPALPPLPGTGFHGDRAFLVWGVEVVYEDHVGEAIEIQALKPLDAAYRKATSTGADGPCPGDLLCQSNWPWLIPDLVDGVMITQETNTTWPWQAGFLQVPADEAWRRFVKHTRDSLRSHPAGPVRTVVDERAWVSDTSSWLSSLRIDNTLTRLGAGVTEGDGANILFLPFDFEDMTNEEGRFAPRPPVESAWPYRAYQPRLTRNLLDESILWNVDTGGDPACEGTWTVHWRAPDCPEEWTYGPVVDTWRQSLGDWRSAIDPFHQYTFAQLIEIDNGALSKDLNDEDDGAYVPGPHTGDFSFDLEVDAAGEFRFGWQIKDDLASLPGVFSGARIDAGDSDNIPRQVEFRLEPPGGCGGFTVEQSSQPSGVHYDFYTELTCVMQDPTPGACP